MTRRRLELIRWLLALFAFGLVIGSWLVEPRGGWTIVWFFALILVGFPAAMLTLHLHPPKWFKYLERPKR